MNVYFPKKATETLDKRMAEIKGRGAQILAQRIAKEVEQGNFSDRLTGLTRYGQPVAKLKRPRKGYYKGATGPPLAPFYFASRVVSAFHAEARRTNGARGQWRITAGWVGVTSKRGVPFLPFHDRGTAVLPARPIFGISPRTWTKIRAAITTWKQRGGR
jgi:hypothetical protein